MTSLFIIILFHQIIFMGMFVVKNILTQRQAGKQIRGRNWEANFSILFFTLFISLSLFLSLQEQPMGQLIVFPPLIATSLAFIILLVNLIISILSLMDIKDSWRIGVLEDQTTQLVTSGIYGFTRNPYFVSYFLMFAGYTILLQNLILLGLSFFGFWFIHQMIKKEEDYLNSVHGTAYQSYQQKVARYLIW